MTRTKKARLGAAALTLALMLTACSGAPEATQTPAASPEATAEPTATPTAEPTATPTASPTPTAEPTQSAAASQAPTAAGELSAEWTDQQFTFDGQNYAIFFPYEQLEAAGWTFDLADYGHADGYILNKGDKVTSTIELTNPNYSEKLRVNVGFVNHGDEAKDILQCEVWGFACEITYGFKRLDSVPEMTIAGGITWGSTKEQVEAAFGEPKDVYTSEDHGYVTYTYQDEFSKYLKLTIFDEMGVTKIEMQNYD
ncbi:MAG: hypothetical protein ACOYJA_00185 [Christensenellales bacterium]|jgi:hypothetical protein